MHVNDGGVKFVGSSKFARHWTAFSINQRGQVQVRKQASVTGQCIQ